MIRVIVFLLRAFSLLVSWGFVSLLAYTWVSAALSEGHCVRICVNEYGEVWLEWVLVPLAWVLVTVGLAATLRQVWRR